MALDVALVAPRDWIDYSQAALTPLIALIAAGIGTAQWWTERNKLRLDLFDRRWVVWEATMVVLGLMTTKGIVSSEEMHTFLRSIKGAKWLFNEDVEYYLTKRLYFKISELELTYTMKDVLEPGSNNSSLALKRVEIVEWAIKQYAVAEKLFGEFMQLDSPFPGFAKVRSSKVKRAAFLTK